MEFRLSLPEFQTPEDLGHALASWVVRKGSDRVLDPAMGTGALLRSVLGRYDSLGIRRGASRIYGIEINPSRARAAAKILRGQRGARPHLFAGDFLLDGFAIDGTNGFDGVICNPPFVRWQEIPSEYRRLLNEKGGWASGSRKSGLAGLHVFFVRKAFEYARPGGRLAFILPSTTFAASYAAPMKHFLKERATIVALLALDPTLEVFPGVMTSISLLLIEKRSPPKSHRSLIAKLTQVPSPQDLRKMLRGSLVDRTMLALRPLQTGLVVSANWTNLVARQPVRQSVLAPLGSIGHVRRGIATGCNAFFTLSRDAVEELGLPPRTVRRFVPGLRNVGYEISPEDIELAESAGEKTYLLYLQAEQGTIPAIRSYLDFGAATGVPEGYLTSHRDKWYRLETRQSAPILFTYMTRTRPRFLHNTSGALYLNNLIGIHPIKRMHQRDLMAFLAILNSDQVLRQLFAIGRGYAGGLLKVEPGDLSKLHVRDPSKLNKRDAGELADSFRRLVSLARVGRGAEGLSKLNEMVKEVCRLNATRSQTIKIALERHSR